MKHRNESRLPSVAALLARLLARMLVGAATAGAILVVPLVLPLVLPAGAAHAETSPDNWAKLRPALFQDREIDPHGDQLIELVTPRRAEDAAVVPIVIHTKIPQTPDRYIKKLYLMIDKNPAPLAAVFEMTPEVGRADIETRVRIEEYSPVRVVIETNDGKLYMTSNFVKASGGCSAPAGKDPAAAAEGVGRMRLLLDGDAHTGQPALVQLMIKHPNNTGMAMDQVTRLYAPPYYVKHIDVLYGGKTVMSADTDISISENPNFRFYVLPHDGGELTVKMVDSKDVEYRKSLRIVTK